MKRPSLLPFVLLPLVAATVVPAFAADDTVTTAVFSRTGNGYQRQYLPNGAPKPEYYAIANGGAAGGTTRDQTVDRLSFADITSLTVPLLYQQGYRYAKDSGQATLLLVFHWGNTLPYNDINQRQSLAPAGKAVQDYQDLIRSGASGADLDRARFALDYALMGVEMENMMRNLYVVPNARLLGYINDINDNNDVRRYVGGVRYNELMADIEEPRYYVIISAYDFQEAIRHNRQKLLWVTRVSVDTQGNSFDDSVAAMVKTAAKYFGTESGKLVRGEELRGRVRLGDVKFIGTEFQPVAPSASTPQN